jgi:hypothetical protein
VGQCGEPEFELCLTGNIGQLVDHAGREREVVGRQVGEGAEPCGPVGVLRLLTVARRFSGDEAGGVDQRGTDARMPSPGLTSPRASAARSASIPRTMAGPMTTRDMKMAGRLGWFRNVTRSARPHVIRISQGRWAAAQAGGGPPERAAPARRAGAPARSMSIETTAT